MNETGKIDDKTTEFFSWVSDYGREWAFVTMCFFRVVTGGTGISGVGYREEQSYPISSFIIQQSFTLPIHGQNVIVICHTYITDI